MLPQRMGVLFVMSFHKADESRLVVDRRALGGCANPGFEIGMERLIIPSRADAAEMGERLFGHIARHSLLREPREGGSDRGAGCQGIDRIERDAGARPPCPSAPRLGEAAAPAPSRRIMRRLGSFLPSACSSISA